MLSLKIEKLKNRNKLNLKYKKSASLRNELNLGMSKNRDTSMEAE